VRYRAGELAQGRDEHEVDLREAHGQGMEQHVNSKPRWGNRLGVGPPLGAPRPGTSITRTIEAGPTGRLPGPGRGRIGNAARWNSSGG
jgi:hypothetical protein